MAHSKSEGGKAPFHDDPGSSLLEDEAADRARVLAVLHELVGGMVPAREGFDVDLVATRTGLPREAVLAVVSTLHNFQLNYIGGKEKVWFDPDPDPEEKRRWYLSGCARQNAPKRIPPPDGADERWGDDVVFSDLPEPPTSPMFIIDSS